MRCLAIGAALLALSLTACGPKTEGGGETAGPAGFPRPTASYVATYKMSDQAGGSREMTIYASGGQMRVEGAMPGANITTATILDPASSQLITFRTGADAPLRHMTPHRRRRAAPTRVKALGGRGGVTLEVVGGTRVSGACLPAREPQAGHLRRR